MLTLLFRPKSLNMTDPLTAAKVFAELDQSEDPQGKQMLGRIDFRAAGLFFPNKEYTSVIEAQQSLEANKAKLSNIFDGARKTQVNGFKHFVGEVVRTDTAVVNMPSIRIGDATHAAHKLHRQLNAYD